MNSPLTDLEQFRCAVDALAAKIAAPAGYMPTYGRTEDGARPHIEFSAGQFHFVVVERGQELERKSSSDPDEILYNVFESVTFSMACHYELRHRRQGEDFRRQMFEKQLELLGQLSTTWRQRTRARLDEVLTRYPFNDQQIT